jgi:D-alanine transaminase
MTLAYLNGEYLPLEQAKVSPMDRSFLFGDAVYEVIPFYQGKGLGLAEHLDRLDNSLAAIEMANPLSHNQWHVIFDTLLTGSQGTQKIYLQVTRGTCLERNFFYPDANVGPTVFAYSGPFTSGANNPGLHTLCREDIRWNNCFIKSNNLLASCMATDLAKRHNAQEVIMHRDAVVTEGGSSNVFIVKDGTVLTTPVGPHILNGITRQITLKLLAELDIPHLEADITLDALKNADEVWITSSTREVAPVVQLDEQAIGDGQPGLIWQQVYTAYSNLTH